MSSSRLLSTTAAVTLALSVAAPLPADDGKPSIDDVMVARDNGAVLVSFRLQDGFDDEVRQRIEAGLPTGFLFEAKLERQRKWWLRWWFNDTVARSQFELVTMYNAVTREYLVNSKHDGKLIDSKIYPSLEDVEMAMSTVDRMPLFHVDGPLKGRLLVRVRAELGSRTLLTLFPTTVYTDWAESRAFRLEGDGEVRPAP